MEPIDKVSVCITVTAAILILTIWRDDLLSPPNNDNLKTQWRKALVNPKYYALVSLTLAIVFLVDVYEVLYS